MREAKIPPPHLFLLNNNNTAGAKATKNTVSLKYHETALKEKKNSFIGMRL